MVGLLSAYAKPAVTRVYLICYGQSNMDTFCKANDGTAVVPAVGTWWFNGTAVVAPTSAGNGYGIITCMNAIKAATGLDVIFQNTAGGGEGIAPLSDRINSPNYQNLIAYANANILPTDAVFILWDQGEGDGNINPHPSPSTYIQQLSTLHAQIVADIALLGNKAKAPFITMQLGTGGGLLDSPPSGGYNQASWHVVQAAAFNSPLFNDHMYFSHTKVDLSRTDGFHYQAQAGTILQGQRFAQAVNTLLGATRGFAHWEIQSATTVDATHTDIVLQHSLGTDFTPTSGIQGFEVSGDNGASWDATGTGARLNATTILLTHPSMSTTSARLIRYEYGFIVPNPASANCSQNLPCPGLANAVFDNSSLTVPLSPTVWDIKANPLSVVPVPTWYDINSSNSAGGTAQTIPFLLLGPPTTGQKFVIFSMVMGQIGAVTPTSVTIRPSQGASVVATLVAKRNLGTGVTGFFYQAVLGSDANAALSCGVDFVFPSNPFTAATVNVYVVPLADLNSATSTAQIGHDTGPSSLTDTCSISVSAGGFVIVQSVTSTNQSQAGYASFSAGFRNNFEAAGGFFGCAANCAGPTTTLTATYPTPVTGSLSGTVSTFMAAWR